MSWRDWFRPSNWLKHFMLKWGEKFAGTFYEGPEPPKRLKEKVQLFRLYYPHATPAEWAEFSLKLAKNSYQEGFVRGHQWVEREWEGPEIDPEVLAEVEGEDWSLAEQSPSWGRMLERGFDPNNPLRNMDADQRRAIVELMQGSSMYPVEIDLAPFAPEEHGTPGFHGDQDDET